MMAWRDYHYWFRGAIIGVLVIILFYILIAIFPSIGEEERIWGWIFAFSLVPEVFRSNFFNQIWLPYIFSAFIYFIYGAIIGSIVGAIKKRKK